METIKNRFIYYKHYDNFKRDLDNKIIAEDNSIVFIEDFDIIWVQGHEYKCNGSDINSSALEELNKAIDKLNEDLKKVIENPTIVDKELNPTSDNAISNKAVYDALSQKADKDALSQKVDKEEVYTKSEIDDKLDNLDLPSGEIKVTNLITLTAAEYQALVDAGEVKEDTYYFTYETEPTTWVFGGTFPITFGDLQSSKFTFGGKFPITLS